MAPKKIAPKKQGRTKHLNETPAQVHFKADGINVTVKIPWSDLERRLHVDLGEAKKRFSRKRKTRKPAAQ